MPPTLCEHFCFGLEQVGDFLFKNSYILSNIIMMVCSVNRQWTLSQFDSFRYGVSFITVG